MSILNVSIPTAKRPRMISRLLDNLGRQLRIPDEIFIIDASPDRETFTIVEQFKGQFAPGVLRYLPSALGLTIQRNVGIDATTADLVGMLDDDVILEPDCLQVMEQFMMSPEGAAFGGISPMITNQSGLDFLKSQRLYHRLGIYEKLVPGKWLFCGEFLEMCFLKPFKGIFPGDFLNGCCMMYRRQVFDRVRPDNNFIFEADDKHLSLRVGWTWKLGILGDAHIAHDCVPIGVRKPRIIQAIRSMRNQAIMIADCSNDRRRIRRYAAFVLYFFVELSRLTLVIAIRGQFNQIPQIFGTWIGWFWNLLQPPIRRSNTF